MEIRTIKKQIDYNTLKLINNKIPIIFIDIRSARYARSP